MLRQKKKVKTKEESESESPFGSHCPLLVLLGSWRLALGTGVTCLSPVTAGSSGEAFPLTCPFSAGLSLGGPSAGTAAHSVPPRAVLCREGRRGLPALPGTAAAAAAGWAACSSSPLQRSLLYCNHTIIMPLKCHIRRNPHKQGISICQKIVVLLLMTHFPPAAPLFFFS